MNKTFDIKRIGMVMHWELLTRWKYYMGATIGCTIGFSLFCLLMLYNSNSPDLYQHMDMLEEQYLTKVTAYSIPLVFIAFYVMASCIFDIMKTKNSRESFLMLPANNIEKYASCFLMKFIGCLVLLFLTLICTDIIQLAFSYILNPGFHVSIALPVMKDWTEVPLFSRMQEEDYIFLTGALFLHSFCVLGGTFYRKMAPLLTFATELVLFLVAGYMLNWLGKAGLLDFHITFNEGNSYIFTTVICIFFLALSAFNYWASYQIFCRMQVISNKWINI